MKRIFALLVGFFAVLAVCQTSQARDDIPPKQVEFFEKKIRPVLIRECYSCHSKKAASVKGGLVVDTREGIRAGGDSGHAVVPGDLDESLIIAAIKYESYEMPPKGQLPDNVIRDFEKWIEMGAPDPREGPSMIKREINFEEAKKHWAFQPIESPEPPAVSNESWAYSDVDLFVLNRLEKQNLVPVADADRLTLIRRLYFDLVGLPPSPSELNRWVKDDSVDMTEKLIDELLDSPGFGERWGRHWLDVVRYAESNGRERNHIYPHAWRFRDYVIQAFNHDKPFDQFIREQIAGDLISADEDQPELKNEQNVATGFLAIGPKLLNEGNKVAFQMDLVDEQIDITTRAFMSLTVSCARCHDHKFDPIPTSEYYSLAGIFRSTQTLYGTKKQAGNRQASDLISLVALNDHQASIQARTKKELAELNKKLTAAQNRQKKLQQQLKTAQKKKNQNDIQQFKRQVNLGRQTVKRLTTEVADLKRNGSADKAMGVREGRVGHSPVYIRGEVSSPKGVAKRGLLTILDPNLEQPLIAGEQSGRMELAEWIVDEQNTLTSRVIVNRVWSHLFGRGLVRTVDNFGATGEAPSHPELLDYLATDFRENGWSVKTLIRKLVKSRTYQLSGTHSPRNYAKDPDNVMLWRHSPQRIDAESLRDAMLAASEQLVHEPANGSPLQKLTGEYGRQRNVSDSISNFRHRSVYLPIVRNGVPEALKLFDFAEPSILVGERPTTTVPTQALFFMNSKFVSKRSDEIAQIVLGDEKLGAAEKINEAYLRILSRPCTADESNRGLKFIKQLQSRLAQSNGETSEIRVRAWSGFCQALFGSAEFRYID